MNPEFFSLEVILNGMTVKMRGSESTLKEAYGLMCTAIEAKTGEFVEVVGFTDTADRAEQRTLVDTGAVNVMVLTRIV